MLEFLKEFSNDEHDAVFFLPGDKEDQIHIEVATYKNPGEKVGGSALGDAYHIILFKENKEGVYDVDRFDAIFIKPFEYISNLIPQNWFGVLAKKTTTSEDFIQKTFDKISEV
jgi:hypothetical protein